VRKSTRNADKLIAALRSYMEQSPAGRYLRTAAELDPRSLACFRIGIAAVLLYDIGLAWSILETWPAMMGYFDGLAPARFLGVGDLAFLQWAFGLYALLALALLVGWRTRWVAFCAWIALTLHREFAGVIDYHDDVLFHALFCAQFVELNACWSLDAHKGRQPSGGDLIAQLGGLGIVVNTVFIYLSTVWEKDGSSWWPHGTAVYYALKDIALSGPVGLWMVEELPLVLLQASSYGVWVLELVGGLALVWPRTRFVGWLLLSALQISLWIIMSLESFPASMLALQIALLPAWVWDRWGIGAVIQSVRQRPRWVGALLWALLVATVFVNIEGRRLWRLEGEYWPYTGAAEIDALRHAIELETHWQMYAPGPPHYGGWWVCVGYTASGEEIDPITGKAPTFAVPPRSADTFRGLGSVYWFVAPDEDGDQQAELTRYFQWVDEHLNPPQKRLTHFLLFFVYEPFRPIQNAVHERKPLWVMRWPEDGGADRPPLRAESMLHGAQVYAPDYGKLGKASWVPEELPPLETY
jgi:hypothetical protein